MKRDKRVIFLAHDAEIAALAFMSVRARTTVSDLIRRWVDLGLDRIVSDERVKPAVRKQAGLLQRRIDRAWSVDAPSSTRLRSHQ